MNRNLKYLLIDILTYLVFIGGIALTFKNAWYSTLISISIILFTFSIFKEKEDVLFFLVGWVLTTSTEILSVYFGVWKYAYPHIFGIPIWLSLGWAYSFLFLRRCRDSFFKLEHVQVHYEKHPDEPKNILLYDLLTFTLALLSILFLWKNNILLTIFLGLILLIQLSRFHTKSDFFLVGLAMLSYSLVDFSITHVGIWTYANTNLSTITTWLPIGYGLIALLVRRIVISLNNIFFKKHNVQID